MLHLISTGAGMFVNAGDSVSTGVLPNNGIVIALDLGTATSGNRLVFQCRSGSTNSSVGDIIGLDGNALPIDSSSGGVTTGVLNIRQQSPATVTVRNRVGSEPALTVAEAGVYTCRIPDESGTIVDVNIGVYATGFNSESCQLCSENSYLSFHSPCSCLSIHVNDVHSQSPLVYGHTVKVQGRTLL